MRTIPTPTLPTPTLPSRSRAAGWLLTLSAACTATAHAQQVSPLDRDVHEGIASTNYPLGRYDARIQTLHSDLPAGMTLQGHAYRRDASASSGGNVASFSVDLEVLVSMSPRTPDTASTTFTDNAGATPITVLPRTTLNFPATARPTSGPAPTFELVIPYSRPFRLDSQGGTVCVDTTIYGNTAPAGPNRNFNPYLDAHVVRGDGSNQVPGVRYGQGCSAPGTTSFSTSLFEVDLDATTATWDLDIEIRRGMPGDGSGRANPLVMIGSSAMVDPWPAQPNCARLTSSEFWTYFTTEPDSRGNWSGTLADLPLLPPGTDFHVQSGTFDIPSHTLAFTNASTVVIPDFGPTTVTAVRVASGSDRTRPTGTLSTTVPVTRFF